MSDLNVPPGLTCTDCGRPFRGKIARRTPTGFAHARKCPRECSIEGCDNPFRGLGYCNAHLMAFKKHGDPLGRKHLTPDHVEDIEWMLKHGETLKGAAERVNLTVSGFEGFLKAQKRTDLLDGFRRRAALARGEDVTDVVELDGPTDADLQDVA